MTRVDPCRRHPDPRTAPGDCPDPRHHHRCGTFNLPYSLAGIGPISIVAIALTTLGALALAVMFAVLCRTW
jgi:hypothetical protein